MWQFNLGRQLMTLRVFGPGSGQKILWLHGWMGNGGEGEGLQSQLGDNVQLICPDLPGHGERSLGETTLDDLLRDIAEMGERCQAAAGYSMGGRLLMMAKKKHRLCITTQCLVTGTLICPAGKDMYLLQYFLIYGHIIHIQLIKTFLRILGLRCFLKLHGFGLALQNMMKKTRNITLVV